jgi:hypothetical protein
MRFFWIGDKEAQIIYGISRHPGQENLADYQSQHQAGAHHRNVRPWYLHQENSPMYLPRAIAPSTLKGCVGTLKDGYIRNVLLPRVPRIQSTSTPATRKPSRCIMARHEPSRCTMAGNATAITYYLQVPRVPTWSDLTRSLSGFGRRTLLPFFPVRLM